MTRRMLGCLVVLTLPIIAAGCSSSPSETEATVTTVQREALASSKAHFRDPDGDHDCDVHDQGKHVGDKNSHPCKRSDDDTPTTLVIDRLTVVALDTGSLVLTGNITATGQPISYAFDSTNAVLVLANLSPFIPTDPCRDQASNYNINVTSGEVSADGGRFAPVADYANTGQNCKATISVTAGLIEQFQPVP